MAERSMRTGTTTGATSADVSARTEDLSTEAKQSAQSAADALRAGKDQAVDDARDMVREMADRQRQRAAESLGGMASALHKSARDLETESGTMAHYTDMAAQRLDEVAGYLRHADWSDIVDGAETFARSQPYWFIGGAVASGFVLARFLKSARGSSIRREPMERGGSAYAPSATATAGGHGGSTASAPYSSTTPGSAAAPISTTGEQP